MLQIALYQAVALEGKKIHWCYFGLYSELCDLEPSLLKISQEVANHFSTHGHSIHHFRAVVLEKVRNQDPYVLKAREHLYIGNRKFDTFNNGLNQEP